MKASHSALVTRLRASFTGPTRARWAGFSLSKWKLSSMCPTVWMPSLRPTHSSPLRVEAGNCHSDIVGRRDRVLRKGVQDVGQHQFLMLLLVIEADLDQRHQLPERVLAGLVKEFHHGGIDMPAIGGDLVGARTGQMAALVAGVARAGADIIGIEQDRRNRDETACSRRSARRAGIARRTRWCGRGAISPGSRPASTGSAGPPATSGAARRSVSFRTAR